MKNTLVIWFSHFTLWLKRIHITLVLYVRSEGRVFWGWYFLRATPPLRLCTNLLGSLKPIRLELNLLGSAETNNGLG